jgi:hypothetical protein
LTLQQPWPDTYGAFGYGGPRAMVVAPGLDLAVSYYDAQALNQWVNEPKNPTNQALMLLPETIQRLQHRRCVTG